MARAQVHAAARLALAPLDDARAGDAGLKKDVASALAKTLAAGGDASSLAGAIAAAGSSQLPPFSKDDAANVAAAAVEAYYAADLRTAVWRLLKHAHGAFGVAALASAAPSAVVLASVKQPMALGVGAGFVARAARVERSPFSGFGDANRRRDAAPPPRARRG